jgi:transposase
MSDLPNKIPPIPTETKRLAKAVFGPGNFYVRVGDRLGAILEDIHLDRFPETGRIARTPGALLPLVTFFEWVEGLTDDQALDAVRTRIDWKYALHLPVNPPVFHQNVLCEFRHSVIVDPLSQGEFQKLVDRLVTLNPPVNNQLQNFEILSLLSAVCLVNRLNWIRQAMQQALGFLAGKHPEWLRQVALPRWYGRFASISSGTNLTESSLQHELSLEELGEDIHYLLEEVHRSNSREINEAQEIKALRLIWKRQFEGAGVALLAQSGASKWNNCDSCRYYAVWKEADY